MLKPMLQVGLFYLDDTMDEGTTQDEFDYSLQVFKILASKYPVYYIEGNHEIGFQDGSPLREFNIVKKLKRNRD